MGRALIPLAAIVASACAAPSRAREPPAPQFVDVWFGTVALRRVRDGWAQLWILEPVGDFWIEIDGSSPGFGVVEGPYGLEGRLWSLGPVAAEPVSGAGAAAATEVELPGGVYMILEVRSGTVRLRPEVPQDMDCGEPGDSVARAEPMPIFEVPLTALLDPAGRPEVEVAYAKGC